MELLWTRAPHKGPGLLLGPLCARVAAHGPEGHLTSTPFTSEEVGGVHKKPSRFPLMGSFTGNVGPFKGSISLC